MRCCFRHTEDLEEENICGGNEFNYNIQSKTNVSESSYLINNLDIGDNGTTQNEKERLKQLLYKCTNIFSKRLTDFGYSNIIEHNIDITGEGPKGQRLRLVTSPL